MPTPILSIVDASLEEEADSSDGWVIIGNLEDAQVDPSFDIIDRNPYKYQIVDEAPQNLKVQLQDAMAGL